MKYDKNKVDLSLLPPEALEAVARVFQFGANKYSTFDWYAIQARSDIHGGRDKRLFGSAVRAGED